MVVETLQGTLTVATWTPMTALWRYTARFIMADLTQLECTWEAVDRLAIGGRLRLDYAGAYAKITDEASGMAWIAAGVTRGDRVAHAPLTISAEMEEDLHQRAAEAGVIASIVYDDMKRPVLVIKTGRGKIKCGISAVYDWEGVLESVGLGGTL